MLLQITLSFALAAIPAAAQVTTSQYDNFRTGATLNEKILTPQNVNSKQFGQVSAHLESTAPSTPSLYSSRPSKFPARARTTSSTSPPSTTASTPSTPIAPAILPLEGQLPRKGRGDRAPPKTTCSAFHQSRSRHHIDARHRSADRNAIRAGTQPRSVTKSAATNTSSICTRSPSPPESKSSAAQDSSPHPFPVRAPARQRTSSIRSFARKSARSAPARQQHVYLTWASSCDVDPYHGWVMAYDPQTLAQKAVLNVNPDGSEAGIWLSDTGPAADAEGNIYVPTGNGTFDAGFRRPRLRRLGFEARWLLAHDPRLLHSARSGSHQRRRLRCRIQRTHSSSRSTRPASSPAAAAHERLHHLRDRPRQHGQISIAIKTISCRPSTWRAEATERWPTGTATPSSPRAMTCCAAMPSRTVNSRQCILRQRNLRIPAPRPPSPPNGNKNAIVWAIIDQNVERRRHQSRRPLCLRRQ